MNESYQIISFRVDERLLKRIQIMSLQEERNVSGFCRNIIKKYLEDKE